MNSTTTQCILTGGQTLLIQCAQALLDRGHGITAIISDDPQATEWAREQNLQVWSNDDALAERVQGETFDYLFSIVNLKISPDFLINAPGKAAINFHDGLLPDYAGLNVTSWALLNGEPEHGVTWHEMLGDVDQGQVFVEKRLPVVPGETALTLNAKCLEAGLETFLELLSGIESGDLQSVPQASREGRFFRGNQKPDNLGVLDFNAGAQAVERLVNALDFGPYRNPITRAKVVAQGQRVFAVSGARVTANASTASPGTLVARDSETGEVTVATGDRDVTLLQLSPISGASEPTKGERFISPGDLGAERLARLADRARRSEGFWLRQLAAADGPAPALGDAHSRSADSDVYQRAPFETGHAQRGLAATCAYMLRFCTGNRGAMPLLTPAELDHAGLLADAVPLDVELRDGEQLEEFTARFTAALDLARRHESFPSDVFERHLELDAARGRWSGQRHPLAILLSDAEQPLPARPSAPLVIVLNPSADELTWWFDPEYLAPAQVSAIQSRIQQFLQQLEQGTAPSAASLLSDADRENLARWNATETAVESACVHDLFRQTAAAHADAPALAFKGIELSYADLDRRASQWANYLIDQGIKPGDRVGVALERSEHLVAVLLGVLKSGAAYVPLDPEYPAERISFMAADSGAELVLTSSAGLLDDGEIRTVLLSDALAAVAECADADPPVDADPASLAYVIYTSGSTGRPKGVMVSHANVANFFAGMDQRVEAGDPGVWLAVTSISFDISVLEIFWTLCRGFKVVLQPPGVKAAANAAETRYPEKNIGFSLFFWNYVNEADRDDPQKYRLLLDAAQYADANGFEAIWTPERHFGSFGGSYPNPSVISAALAVQTSKLKIRAGSVVMPLHSPIRVAEDWSIVDNLSGGRVGISFASGWQPNDFVIKPEGFENSKQVMLDGIDAVRKLWRGETLEFEGPKGPVSVQTLPRPIQPELPVWVTTAGNPDSFKKAGERGANLLTHLLGQTVEQVGENIRLYREAWKAAGHPGEGHVTLMLHTLVGDDEDAVREKAREPMKNYLKSAMFLVKDAAWEFPTFKKMSEETGRDLDDFFATISDDDMDALLEFAFQRYYGTSGLFGTPARCMALIDSLKEIEIDEIGCLIDYGLENSEVMAHLPAVGALLKSANPEPVAADEDDDYQSIPAQMARHDVSHFQCTPSQVRMLIADPESHAALAGLSHLMLGGEPLPLELAQEVKSLVSGRVSNMYGPTETTIWSTTWDLPEKPVRVAIGTPIANTRIEIVDENLALLPPGSVGEILIGGDGVVPGYHDRPELTAERFVSDPRSPRPGSRLYRTGDLGRFGDDGLLECLGRSDTQVKIRGYRVELGEIESLIAADDGIRRAAVVMREDVPGDQQLVAYLTLADGHEQRSAEQWRSRLSRDLPDFMLPAHFVTMDQWPLTPNGKLDRNALPARGHDVVVEASAPPAEGMEANVAAIWCDLLNRTQVGVNDNFFDIGGHSLLAVQVLNKVRGLVSRQVQMTDLFRYPTIRTLARYLEQEDAGSESEALESSDARARARRQSIQRRRGPRARQVR